MKHLPGHPAQFGSEMYVCRIDLVAQHGMPDGRHVLTNLVSSSGFNAQLEMAGDPGCTENRQACNRGLPVDRRRDFAQVDRDLSGDDGVIGLCHAMAFEELDDRRLRVELLGA